jgi:hypothetical protein
VFKPTLGERVYYFIDDAWKMNLEYDEMVNMQFEVMYHYNLSEEEAKKCIENYHMGVDWFRKQMFLQ